MDTQLYSYLKELKKRKCKIFALSIFKMCLGALIILASFVCLLLDDARSLLRADLISQYVYLTLIGLAFLSTTTLFLYCCARKTVSRLIIVEAEIDKINNLIQDYEQHECVENSKLFSATKIILSFLEQIAIFNPINFDFIQCRNVKALNCNEVELFYFSNIRPK